VDRTTTSQPRRSAISSRTLLRMATVAVIISLGAGTGPASARQDPGTPPGGRQVAPNARAIPSMAELRAGLRCPLRRVGTQYVRCDNLTGAGAKAPAWVPELT
jgi:hypothetical protein